MFRRPSKLTPRTSLTAPARTGSAEAEIEERRPFLKTIIESIPYPFVVIDIRDHTIKVANHAARASGLVEGGHCFDAHAGCRPCQDEGYVCPIEEMKRTRRPVVAEHVHVDAQGRPRHVELHASPIFEDDGSINYMIEHSLDVTERKLVEAALAESEEKYRSLVEQSLMGVYIMQDGLFRFVNPRLAEIFGYRREEMEGRLGPLDVSAPEDQALVAEKIRRRLSGEAVLAQYTFRGLTRDGRLIDVEVAGALTTYQGRPALHGSLMDVTERKRSEEALRRAKEELERAARLKDEFLSMATHELKTPIGSIKIFAELAQRRPEAFCERLPEMSAALNRQADQLLALVNDLLDVARLQLGRMPMVSEVLDLAALARQVCEQRHILLPRRSVECRCGSGPISVRGDAVRLEQVVSNLLDNAAKYSPEGGHIRVCVERRGDRALLAVTDKGIGIAPEHMPHIFERFYKPGPQQSVYSGLGVGLYICRQIVERHGGRIWAESEGEGRGSAFFVELPWEGK